MSKFIKLTVFPDGNQVSVNMENVLYIVQYEKSSKISLVSSVWVDVKESADEIVGRSRSLINEV